MQMRTHKHTLKSTWNKWLKEQSDNGIVPNLVLPYMRPTVRTLNRKPFQIIYSFNTQQFGQCLADVRRHNRSVMDNRAQDFVDILTGADCLVPGIVYSRSVSVYVAPAK